MGLNHEFARELLWREPTDQRGSTFRQFWDVRGFFNAVNLMTRAELRDIPPLHVAHDDETRHATIAQGGDNEENQTASAASC